MMYHQDQLLLMLSLVLIGTVVFAERKPVAPERVVVDVWPGTPPGEVTDQPEAPRPGKGDDIIRLEHVSKPTLTVYRPKNIKGVTPAVVVCPGGGYSILAMNLEGTEVAEWLNGLGVTAFLLKYRVPKNRAGAFQDIQRALRLVRTNAGAWAIDPERVGVIGFSAGGHLCARLSTGFKSPAYDPIDETDRQSCRPDFAMLVYPAYLSKGDQLAAELPVTAETPRTILIQTQDDRIRIENSVFYYLALKKAGVPSELHAYPTGGHGYGLRPSPHAVSQWPSLCATWLEKIGILLRGGQK
jgi:acetyl esterase/lipase